MIEPLVIRGITYAAEITDCPECNGYGYFETLIRLSYEGDQTWRTDPCEHCDNGKSLEPVRCELCNDEIEMKDFAEWQDGYAHQECADNEEAEPDGEILARGDEHLLPYIG